MSTCDKLTPEIHVGDVDTAFIFKLSDLSSTVFDPETECEAPAFDVSDASIGAGSREMIFKKPDGTVVTVAATLTTLVGPGDGTGGYIEYRTVSGFLDQAGQWKRQARITTDTGTWSSSTVCFTVHPNLD